MNYPANFTNFFSFAFASISKTYFVFVINQLTGSLTKFHYTLTLFAMAMEFDEGFDDVPV
jgi:hypothetical protein